MPARMPLSEQRLINVQTRVNAEEFAELEAAMDLENLGPFQWVRDTLLARARRVNDRG